MQQHTQQHTQNKINTNSLFNIDQSQTHISDTQPEEQTRHNINNTKYNNAQLE